MRITLRTFTSITAISVAASLYTPITAQITTAAGTNRPLELDADSPFRDPDIIYLEADELINDEEAGKLTATGQVEGRYQDRTLRADNVLYNLRTGIVIATGNVVLIDATGSTQYADKLELSDELEAGTAANFTARTATGGTTAARFVTRNDKEEIELYNAYYTACKLCTDGVDADGNPKSKKPSWRLKARRVRQDNEKRTVFYNDAVFEIAGIPVFYTPYLAHPDPSADRASGFLAPFGRFSGNRGLEIETPYYYAIDDYTELTLTPRLFTKVNPLLEYNFRRNFNTGYVDVEGSLTYGSIFDRNGNAFDDPALFTNNGIGAPIGRRVRSHFNARGEFNPNDTWGYGFGVQLTTDDNFLQRYDISEQFNTPGLIERESRRNVSQAYLVGQDDDFRFTITAAGFQDLRSRIVENSATGQFAFFQFDDAQLPIIAPKIEAEKYFTDPLLGGRARAFGDFTALTREVGTDYLRASAGLDYSKSAILPGGIEAKAFANGRFDQFDIEIEDGDNGVQGNDVSFNRGLGQVGGDIRYPFIKQAGGVTWIIEPRVQATYSFGDGKLENFNDIDANGNPISLFQDGVSVDFDQALFWQSNKSTGFDFWQEGFRADVGAALRADWGPAQNAELFIGQSYASNTDGDFAIGSGLENDKSDVVALFNANLTSRINANARLRFDDDTGSLRRVDANLGYRGDIAGFNARYFRLDSAANDLALTPLAPSQEVSGSAYINVTKNWRTGYSAFYDIDDNNLRRQTFSLAYSDNCTRFEFFHSRNNFNNDLIRDTSSFGFRISLLTLGDFGASSDDLNQPR